VTDSSGAAVPGSAVVLANAESKTERTAATGGQGEYEFLLLPPGTYTLTVTASGFLRVIIRPAWSCLVNTPATANVQLKVGQMTQSVTVSSEAPPLP
jgi:carboxypeptidase family protein